MQLDTRRMDLMLKPWAPDRMRVGKWRSAERDGEELILKLHDKPLVVYNPIQKRISFDLCGFWTVSAIKAMREYSVACGVNARPALRGGRFTAEYGGTTYTSSWGNKITINT